MNEFMQWFVIICIGFWVLWLKLYTDAIHKQLVGLNNKLLEKSTALYWKFEKLCKQVDSYFEDDLK